MGKAIHTYHFISNPTGGTENFLRMITNLNAVACFDLEDSIKSFFSQNDSQLKTESRDAILNFLEENKSNLLNCRIGVRINRWSSEEFKNDLLFLKSFNSHLEIDCVFLPKIETSEELIENVNVLINSGIIYNDIIPIIETKKGLENFPQIVKEANEYFIKFAFGHCDFNLDNRIFPFHHQYSLRYWDWVEQIYSIINSSNKVLINSPFLFLNDSNAFNLILSQLNKKFKSSFGQITLTLNQTKLCSDFDCKKESNHIKGVLKSAPGNFSAKEIIENFEKNILDSRSFAVTPDDKILISPQEYLAAKTYGNSFSGSSKEVKVLIVGGCFTEQHNIEPSQLYHQLLANELKIKNNVSLNLQILRYERLSKCFDKISELIKVQKPDLMLFHIRPEPLLRICKFYYKYKDAIGRLIRTLNFAALGKSFPETHNYQISPAVDRTYEYPKEGVFHRFLINYNYLFGIAVGNLDYGLKLYLELVKQVRRLCEKEKIKLLVIGTVSRPHTFLENWLADKLHIYISSWADQEDAHYINCIGKYSKDNKSLFDKEGIYVNKIGHRRIAKLIQAGLIENHFVESIENKIELHEEVLL